MHPSVETALTGKRLGLFRYKLLERNFPNMGAPSQTLRSTATYSRAA